MKSVWKVAVVWIPWDIAIKNQHAFQSKLARSSGLPGATLATKAGEGAIAATVFSLESG